MTTKEQLLEELQNKLFNIKGETFNERLNQQYGILDQAYDRIREDALREAESTLPPEMVYDKYSNRLAVSSSLNRTEGWNKCLERARAAIQSLITKK